MADDRVEYRMGDAWPSVTVEMQAPEGRIYVRVARPPGTSPRRGVEIRLGRAGGVSMAAAEGLGRIVSLLTMYLPMDAIAKSLRGVTHERSGWKIQRGEFEGSSLCDAVARGLIIAEKELSDGT